MEFASDNSEIMILYLYGKIKYHLLQIGHTCKTPGCSALVIDGNMKNNRFVKQLQQGLYNMKVFLGM